jgi:hypothetical protein
MMARFEIQKKGYSIGLTWIRILPGEERRYENALNIES